MFKVVRAQLKEHGKISMNPTEWITVIEENPRKLLTDVSVVDRNKLFVIYLEDVKVNKAFSPTSDLFFSLKIVP